MWQLSGHGSILGYNTKRHIRTLMCSALVPKIGSPKRIFFTGFCHDGGMSMRRAAACFSIGIATAGAWARLKRSTGAVRPARQRIRLKAGGGHEHALAQPGLGGWTKAKRRPVNLRSTSPLRARHAGVRGALLSLTRPLLPALSRMCTLLSTPTFTEGRLCSTSTADPVAYRRSRSTGIDLSVHHAPPRGLATQHLDAFRRFIHFLRICLDQRKNCCTACLDADPNIDVKAMKCSVTETIEIF